jgi:copper chaperone CopZ
MKRKETAMSTKTKYRVVIRGMKCRGCVESVKRVLAGVPGVEADSVAIGEAVVGVRKAGDAEEIRAGLRQIGFESEVFPIFALKEVSHG